MEPQYELALRVTSYIELYLVVRDMPDFATLLGELAAKIPDKTTKPVVDLSSPATKKESPWITARLLFVTSFWTKDKPPRQAYRRRLRERCEAATSWPLIIASDQQWERDPKREAESRTGLFEKAERVFREDAYKILQALTGSGVCSRLTLEFVELECDGAVASTLVHSAVVRPPSNQEGKSLDPSAAGEKTPHNAKWGISARGGELVLLLEKPRDIQRPTCGIETVRRHLARYFYEQPKIAAQIADAIDFFPSTIVELANQARKELKIVWRRVKKPLSNSLKQTQKNVRNLESQERTVKRKQDALSRKIVASPNAKLRLNRHAEELGRTLADLNRKLKEAKNDEQRLKGQLEKIPHSAYGWAGFWEALSSRIGTRERGAHFKHLRRLREGLEAKWNEKLAKT